MQYSVVGKKDNTHLCLWKLSIILGAKDICLPLVNARILYTCSTQLHIYSNIIFTDSEGKIVKTFDTVIERKVISPSTSKEMRNIMQYEVEHGSGTTAIIEGYSIGGKTGTAQKAIRGGYSKYDYYASFVCMAPMEDPQITLLVVVDTPRGSIYGATVAAPAAKKILKNVLRYMAISPSTETETKSKSQNITVPDLTGMTYKQAETALENLGLKILPGDGEKGDGKWKIVDQYPKPKTKVSKKTTVYVYKE